MWRLERDDPCIVPSCVQDVHQLCGAPCVEWFSLEPATRSIVGFVREGDNRKSCYRSMLERNRKGGSKATRGKRDSQVVADLGIPHEVEIDFLN